MRVLGIDPGYAICGFGIVDFNKSQLRHIDSGIISTASDVSFPLRLEKIHTAVKSLIDMYKPDVMAVEELFLGRNKTTVIGTAQARGVSLLAASEQNISVYEFTPMQVKKAVTGSGKADKNQVQFMVKTLLQLAELPKPDDKSDALAVAICQCFTGRLSAYEAMSGYQKQAQRKRYSARVNVGKLKEQLKQLT